MAEKGKKAKLPVELEEFLKEVQENISLYPETIVYNHIKDYVTDLSTKQVAWLTSTILITTEFRLRIFKKRCDEGDKLACEFLDLMINGDPYSKNITVKKGLMGLWQVDDDVESGKLLVEVGRITQEEFDRVIRIGKEEETIKGKTRKQLICELAAESKKYPTADAFSMAMIMGRLQSVPQPNTANVYKIIEGKYSSGEEFWAAVQKGEICAGAEVPEKKEEIPAPPEAKKEKETLPIPQKEKEAPKPEPIRAPAKPVIPVPEPGRKPHELDLMKQEIEESIARMKAEKARGELKAGEENGEDYVVIWEVYSFDTGDELYKGPDEATANKIYDEHKKKGEAVRKKKSVIERSRHELREDLPKKERIKLAKQIAATYPKHEEEGETAITLDNIASLPKEKRIELAKKIWVREDADILTEPRDYSQWTFGDFEGLLPGLESVEDLEELFEQVGASEVISEGDKETLRNMIKARIDEAKRFYTEWAAREDK
ncbi:MAG: hypothetical protein Q8J68_07820 [Methanolobus sp.]|uniref:hypothetical protein n=1 Tax=Methanolobus sp. TaxID=1874737 RepID=UPI002732127F|nr:hypothetical protein [Methanolobus sp.]MDP2217175.1 hypothetical protein [Methanolobus sp.]